MGTLVLVDPVAGTTTDATQQASNNAAIKAVVNGGIDATNFAAGLIFNPNKIQQASAIDGDSMTWDNTLTKWTPASTLATGRPRAPRVVTSSMAGGPPASPVDGDIWIATAVDANGTRWQFQYNAGSGSAYKWEFIGGPPALASNINQDSGNFGGTWGDLASVVGFTVARGGDYVCSAASVAISGAASDVLWIGIAAGAVSPTWYSSVSLTGGGQAGLAVADAPLAAVAASTQIKIRYVGGGQVCFWKARSLSVLPTRIA